METKDKEKVFNTALQLLNLEAQLLSNLFTTFLIAHSIIVGALIATIMDNDFSLCFSFNLKVFIIGSIGFVLCILWLSSYLRGASYYSLRISQAYENEPNGWNLYGNIEDKFSKGKKVEIGDNTCRISYFGRFLRIRTIMIILIIVFMLAYISSLFTFGPWF